MKRQQYQPDALIEVLHKAQELFGYLSIDLLLHIAHSLKLPPSWVYGVATFYHFFSLAPQGEHTCVVCLGTACYVKGADKVLAAVEDRVNIKAGETTSDNELSLFTARCIGACGIAPAVVYDGTQGYRELSVRERSRLRPQLFEALGWRYVPLWTIDVFSDPDKVANMLAGFLGLEGTDEGTGGGADAAPAGGPGQGSRSSGTPGSAAPNAAGPGTRASDLADA